ncbi:MAG: hypothetical protein HOP29_01075 [Phycisphaerales bacterium]|nr:hypothetical protein [Phycisphaerales bacterium]
MKSNPTKYCVFIDTIRDGTVPSVCDGEGKPCLFETRLEAEREIADNMITRLQEFIDGERDFDDAITTEEYVDEVNAPPHGSFIDSTDRHFEARVP